MNRNLRTAMAATASVFPLALAVLLCGAASLRAAPPAAPAAAELQIASTPAEAAVSIDRAERGATPLTVGDLAPGEHLVTISKRGYRDHYATVKLAAGTRRLLDIQLEPLITLVIVHSEPAGATVSCDGVDLGTTPLLVTTLPPGAHRLRLSLAGFQPSEREVIADARTPAKIAVPLLSDSGTLAITTQPAGAAVSVNGIPRGESPCTVERIPEGEIAVAVRAEGYLDIEQRVRLSAGETQRLDLTLQPRPATLQVTSIPAGARVYVNNNRRGETPLTLNDLAPGDYRIRVEQDGYDPLARDVRLDRGASVPEEFRLTPNTGAIQVTTTPAGVEIFIGGKRVGVTIAARDETTNLSDPLQIDGIGAGAQRLKFVRKGWAETEVTMDVTRGQTTTRHVTLERLFIPDYEIVTVSGTVYRGVFEAITDIGVRLETAPGVMTVVPHKEIRRRGSLRVERQE